MAKRRSGIRKHDARVLLSDVLPYELPPTYSNRGIYDLTRHSHLRMNSHGIEAQKIDLTTETRLRILLGKNVAFPVATVTGEVESLNLHGAAARDWTIPFQYTVKHRGNDYRTLTIPHPAAQLAIASFYAEYEQLLLYHTAKSPFSLRRPTRVARYSVVRDWLFETRRSGPDSVERDHHEYEWLRSYFTYRRYSNVYKFYDSKEYRSCERRFGYLVKADVAKCFDSIYTHSVAWAAHGHEVVKANLDVKGTFGGDFDRLMQHLNHNETSGITIGSEVSRIFAEVILQAVDLDIQKELTARGLRYGQDYEILRYVDDYFIFLADSGRRPEVLEILARKLRAYKLHLNAAKEDGEFTPWLSPLTVAKSRVVDLLRKTIHRDDKALEQDELPQFRVETGDLIVGYKAILIDTGVSHFELANYALSRAERALEGLVKSSQKGVGPDEAHSVRARARHYDAATSACLGLVDFVFFAYSGAPRMSPAVKVARVTSSLLRYSRQPGFPAHDREQIEMRVRDELFQQLLRARGTGTPDAVTATLIDCVSDLGPHYRISEEQLAQLVGFTWEDGKLIAPQHMNALLLFSILFHIGSSRHYQHLLASCEDWVLLLLARPERDAERAIVSLNILSCKVVSRGTRSRILAAYGENDEKVLDLLAKSSTYANVDWNSFDLYAALQQKRLYEVY